MRTTGVAALKYPCQLWADLTSGRPKAVTSFQSIKNLRSISILFSFLSITVKMTKAAGIPAGSLFC